MALRRLAIPGAFQAAVAAAQRDDDIEVCPDLYNEHVVVNKPLRLGATSKPEVDDCSTVVPADPARHAILTGATFSPGEMVSSLVAGLLLAAPEQLRVRLETSKGPIVMEVHRAWAPRAADHFHELVTRRYYDDTRFFRVVAGSGRSSGSAAIRWRGAGARPRFLTRTPHR